MGDGLTFRSAPLDQETEITGPSALKIALSSTTIDADVFVVLQVFAPNREEVVFQGAIDPHTPIGQGWLRASHRKLDEKLSLPYRPYHTHDEIQPLTAGEKIDLDIEIWPTSIVVPQGYHLAVTIRGKDYEYAGERGGAARFCMMILATDLRIYSAARRRSTAIRTARPMFSCRLFPQFKEAIRQIAPIDISGLFEKSANNQWLSLTSRISIVNMYDG
jgi:predicted acyl esterase